MKRVWVLILIIITILISVTIFLDHHVSRSTAGFLYNDAFTIPYNKTGVLLGTSKFIKRGQINEFWKNRIAATLDLYKLGKIKYIIISGDNSTSYYDEPIDMKKELVRSEVPDSVIYLDYAGFRTFDSMIRANKIFGQDSFTVISQEFHNQRAVYIARHFGLHAIGYNAKEVTAYNGFRTKVREKFARVKLFIDLLMDKQPHFLGGKIVIKN